MWFWRIKHCKTNKWCVFRNVLFSVIYICIVIGRRTSPSIHPSPALSIMYWVRVPGAYVPAVWWHTLTEEVSNWSNLCPCGSSHSSSHLKNSGELVAVTEHKPLTEPLYQRINTNTKFCKILFLYPHFNYLFELKKKYGPSFLGTQLSNSSHSTARF